MGNYTILKMFENPRRGRQARNFTRNVPKILDLKSPSEQIFSENCRWVPLNESVCLLSCIVMFDRPKNSMLGPLPGVNQSRKYLRTFLCHRISFCPISSSPFLAKKDMYKSLSLPSGDDSALRSCVT